MDEEYDLYSDIAPYDDSSDYSGGYGGYLGSTYDPRSDPTSDAFQRLAEEAAYAGTGSGAPMTMEGAFGKERTSTYGGGGAGIMQAQIAQQTALKQLAEQIREYDIQQAAMQQSAMQSAQGLTGMINEYNKAYAQSIQQYNSTYNAMLGLVKDVGGQQASDIRSQYGALGARQQQNLQKLGMGGTTVGASLEQGTQRSQSAALNTLASQLNEQQLGIMKSQKTAKDLAPDTTLLQSVLSAGQAASGPYGGLIGQAFGGISYGSSTPITSNYDPSALAKSITG